MISSVIVWLLIAFESAVFGNALFALARPSETARSIRVSTSIIAFGFIAVITLASYLSIFFSLSSLVSITILASSVFLYLITKPKLILTKSGSWAIILLILITVFILETTTRRPSNSDTNLYHAQAIHWIENFPAIRGLGNLHGRLAFNSAWLTANAFYSLRSILGRSLHVVSGFYFFFFCVFALSIRQTKEPGRTKFTITTALLLFAAFQYLASDISSPGTDVPAALSVWMVFLITLYDVDHPDPSTPIFITALASFAVVVKLSSLMIMLVPAGYFINNLLKRKHASATTQLIIGLFILLPFLIRNLIQSGYLIYPFPALDFFNFAWKVPLERVVEEKNAILVWGRLPKLPIQDVLAMPFSVWLPKWFANLTVARKALVIFSASSPLFAFFNFFFFRSSRRNTLLHLAFSAGVYFWLASTPDVRFGYSFLIPAAILNILPLLIFLIQRSTLHPMFIERFASVVLILFIGISFARSIELSTIMDRLLLPRDYDRVKTQACEIDGVQIFCAVEYNACSYHAFPCVPQQKDWVKRLGPALEDGFYGEK